MVEQNVNHKGEAVVRPERLPADRTYPAHMTMATMKERKAALTEGYKVVAFSSIKVALLSEHASRLVCMAHRAAFRSSRACWPQTQKRYLAYYRAPM